MQDLTSNIWIVLILTDWLTRKYGATWTEEMAGLVCVRKRLRVYPKCVWCFLRELQPFDGDCAVVSNRKRGYCGLSHFKRLNNANRT